MPISGHRIKRTRLIQTEMYAARISNERTQERSGPVFGVVSTGAAWKFLRLDGDEVKLDRPEHFIDNLPQIMGILKAIAESA